MEDTELNLDELRNVTALEAWCLAAAIASLVAAGDTNVSATITTIASDIYDKVTAEVSNDEG
jgi:hypothetical protein